MSQIQFLLLHNLFGDYVWENTSTYFWIFNGQHGQQQRHHGVILYRDTCRCRGNGTPRMHPTWKRVSTFHRATCRWRGNGTPHIC
jgi:hypothetical protein